MAQFDADTQSMLQSVRRRTRMADHVQHAQIMLVAAGVTAFAIVAVAATIMSTLL